MFKGCFKLVVRMFYAAKQSQSENRKPSGTWSSKTMKVEGDARFAAGGSPGKKRVPVFPVGATKPKVLRIL